ncbi:hypothetical protein J4729_04340 [Leisingera sp. HS039]|uniref:hypothetical protein n=1 Tax=Leisingera sp. HS039 TaxID=2818496 RepID=UPI001B3A26E6|nr:hypothetical protein [Leisingera sp. HS039]MBQ4823783.1 hypothetical protein [Leisingera sp. HS039]
MDKADGKMVLAFLEHQLETVPCLLACETFLTKPLGFLTDSRAPYGREFSKTWAVFPAVSPAIPKEHGLRNLLRQPAGEML